MTGRKLSEWEKMNLRKVEKNGGKAYEKGKKS